MSTSLLDDIRADLTYKKFKTILMTTKGKLKLEEAEAEALSLHLSRTSRTMSGADRYSAKKLIDAAYKDLACRSRLVEIRVKNDKYLSHLIEATASMSKYIRTEYADDLKEFGASLERTAYVDRVLKVARDTIQEGKQLLDMLDQLIKDVDQAGFQIKAVVALLTLLSEKRGQVL